MYNIIQELANARALDELKKILISYFAQEKITSIALTYYQKHTKTGIKPIYDWVTPRLQQWHQYYLEQNYANVDRTLEAAEFSLLPVYWNVHEQLQQAKNIRERRIRLESIDFDIDKGLSIVCYGPQGEFIVCVLHQRFGEYGLEQWQSKQLIWMGIVQSYFHYLKRLLCTNRAKLKLTLTKREQQCLELTTKGMRIDMIASTLGITVRTCHFHLQNVNKKLGVNNKYLAVLRWQDLQYRTY